jgi:hypothetical protein
VAEVDDWDAMPLVQGSPMKAMPPPTKSIIAMRGNDGSHTASQDGISSIGKGMLPTPKANNNKGGHQDHSTIESFQSGSKTRRCSDFLLVQDDPLYQTNVLNGLAGTLEAELQNV